MRLRGMVHNIPAQPQVVSPEGRDWGIPGWARVVMVLYKPNKHYLLENLDRAIAEDDAVTYPFGPPPSQPTMLDPNLSAAEQATTQQLLAGVDASGQTLEPTELEAQLERRLRQTLLDKADAFKFDRHIVERLDEKYGMDFLGWHDIEYAYVYEGALLPGKKIMMGRYWRVAMNGEGDGMEWTHTMTGDEEDTVYFDMDNADPDAMDVDGEDAGVAATTEPEARERHVSRERGPFVFWC
jgi:hypothetical protein